MNSNWHQLEKEDVFLKLDTGWEGISEEEAKKRQVRHGKNLLPKKPKVTLGRIIINQFLSPLIYVLLAAALVSILLREYSDAGFIFLVLMINAVIGAFQEWKAESQASALQDLIKIHVRVKRGGKELNLDSEELVPGDIVFLESGSKVPADLRILKCNNLAAEEAILTGESMAVDKMDTVLKTDSPVIAERVNMLYAGTTITAGRGIGVVAATGLATEIGKIASSLKSMETGKAPLVERMEVFAQKISFVTLFACLFLGIIGYYNGISLSDIFFFVVAVAVSAIPEGLPIAMTVALSIGTSRMAKRNVIVRKLTAVEGLGSCTLIATDKTGTLTVDQQTVKKIILKDGSEFAVTGEGYSGEGKIIDKNGNPVKYGDYENLDRVVEAITLCNEGMLRKEGDTWHHAGDPIDVALLSISYKSGSSPSEFLKNILKIQEIPFESDRKYAAVYYKSHNGLQVAVKGAIEKLLEKSADNDYSELSKKAEELAGNGYRIIAVGYKVVDEIHKNDVKAIDLIGVLALIDPLRPEAKVAVEACKNAHVDVAMITGDHPATALSIARELGIADSKEDLITGHELSTASGQGEAVFRDALRQKKVFSRVSPTQKHQIVEGFRAMGHFIAVTGDGVNDAPALKAANIGIAMGYGTDVAKDTASIIVSDNNFASIAAGVEEGRATYSNLRKIIYLLISTGAAELLMIGFSLIFQLPLPFLPVQLLWLNLVTNGFQHIALAFEPREGTEMLVPPRNPAESVFNNLMIKQTLVSALVISLLSFGLWYHLLNHLYWDEVVARNTVLLLMVLLQNFHVLNCRSETESIFKLPFWRNPLLILCIIAAQGTHVVSMHIPFMQDLLAVSPISVVNWLKLFGTASLILLAMEVFKFIQTKTANKMKVSGLETVISFPRKKPIY